MSALVAAFGSSHSVMLTCTLEDWQCRFLERDRAIGYFDRNGKPCTYDDLLAATPPGRAHLVEPAAVERRYREVQAAIARLKRDIEDARLDVLIVCGDDQNELFSSAHMPSIAVYCGGAIHNTARPDEPPADWYARAQSIRQEPGRARDYPCDAKFATAIIEGLIARGFDPGALSALPPGQGEGHAFSFVHRFYLPDGRLPIVPVFLNTFYPPNQPTPARCVAVGEALASVVEQYPGDMRVGLMASGGLSHFHVEEELDRHIIEALKTGDTKSLAAVDPQLIQSGSSEIRNWMVVAGAASHLRLQWLSYTPGYRTPALTGTGLTFAAWR